MTIGEEEHAKNVFGETAKVVSCLRQRRARVPMQGERCKCPKLMGIEGGLGVANTEHEEVMPFSLKELLVTNIFPD